MIRIWVLCALFAFGIGPSAGALTLTRGGRTEYTILIAAKAASPEVTAAKELQSHLKLVAGATIPIRTETAVPRSRRVIVVGVNARFRAAFPNRDIKSFKHDGIIVQTVGDTLYLAGGSPRGTLYAVYTFLEEVVGCRWWGSRPDETYIPKRPTLTVAPLNMAYVPPLQYREAFYRNAFDGVYAARSRCNGQYEQIPVEYGGHYTILGWCHTFYQLLPPEKYFAQHPEWYSEIDGKRVGEAAQLCLTNEEMRRELVRNALAWLRKNPQAGMISISQNDYAGACQCPKCRQVVKEEGAESGPLLRFVNAVAADIEKEFPGTLVETLAYQYTRTPPKLVKPRHNVVIRLSTIECSFSEPLATGPQNTRFKTDMEAWSAIAPQLYVWDYVTDFTNYLIPHPNLRVLAPNIRFFVKNKAIGLFEQGDAQSSCSDFPELRAWLLAHLMWDPNRDEKALIMEFMRGYYGAGAEPLLQYIETIHDAVERNQTYLSCGLIDTSPWMTYDDMEKSFALFRDAAARVKDNPVLSARVRRARMPLDHALLQRYYVMQRAAKAMGKAFFGPKDPVAFCEDFIKTAHTFNVGSYRESQPFANYEPVLRARFHPAVRATIPEICKGLPEDAWVDVQDNEFALHNAGVWVSLVDDPKSSDGRAARMPANHRQWATQWPISGDLKGRWQLYVVVKCEAKTRSGDAFQIGVYDSEDNRYVAEQTVKLEQCADGEYKTYNLGPIDLKPTMYFWAAPMNNPDKVESVSVDRIFFVRDSKR